MDEQEIYCINCGEDKDLAFESSKASSDIYKCRVCGEEIYVNN